MEEFFVFLLWLIGLILSVWVDFIIAKKFEAYAEDKGYNGESVFWWLFLAMPIGVAMVTAMPNKKMLKNQETIIRLMREQQDPELAQREQEEKAIEEALKF